MPITYPTPAEVWDATDFTNIDSSPAIQELITYLEHAATPAIPYFNDQWGLTGKPNAMKKWTSIRRGRAHLSSADINCLVVGRKIDSLPRGTQDRVSGISLTIDDVAGQLAESDEAIELPWLRIVPLVNSLYYVRNAWRPVDSAVWNRLIFEGASLLQDPLQKGFYGVTTLWHMVLAPGRQ